MNNIEIFGRLRIIKEYTSKIKGFSLNIGCKETSFGDVNIDIDHNTCSDSIADVLNLPFKDNTFDLVLFTDVIEHIPENTELRALSEIYRVLKLGGRLILTTPNDRPIYTYLDPAKYIVGHRHYKTKEIIDMIENVGFRVEKVFTMGGFWEMIGVLWYCFITYPIKKIFNINLSYVPKSLMIKIDKEYNNYKHKDGYTIFIVAKKYIYL